MNAVNPPTPDPAAPEAGLSGAEPSGAGLPAEPSGAGLSGAGLPESEPGPPGYADGPPGYADELPEYADRVLTAAERIPPGRVMTYGDVAEYVGEGGPRQVGRVMALYGGAAPWWRVVRADGRLLPGHELRALAHYREEGTPLRPAGPAAEGHIPRLDMARARWDGGGSSFTRGGRHM